jgi:hypothetical protein
LSIKVWIFGFSSPLDAAGRDLLDSHMKDYLADWNSHGASIEAEFALIHDQFLMVSVADSSVEASGCSIDSLFEAVRKISSLLKLELLDENDVVYFNGERFESCSRQEFRRLVENASVSQDILVADFTDPSMDFIKPAENSWHGKVFFNV